MHNELDIIILFTKKINGITFNWWVDNNGSLWSGNWLPFSEDKLIATNYRFK